LAAAVEFRDQERTGNLRIEMALEVVVVVWFPRFAVQRREIVGTNQGGEKAGAFG